MSYILTTKSHDAMKSLKRTAVALATATLFSSTLAFSQETCHIVGDHEVLTMEPIEYQGNLYDIAVIGGQAWFAQDLVATTFADGTDLPEMPIGGDWMNDGVPYRSSVPSTTGLSEEYGLLYNFYSQEWAANNGTSMCPSGWRLPSSTDLNTMITALGGSLAAPALVLFNGTSLWDIVPTVALGGSDLNLLPSGYKGPWGNHYYIGERAFIQVESSLHNMNYAVFVNPDGSVQGYTSTHSQFTATPIRCMKDL